MGAHHGGMSAWVPITHEMRALLQRLGGRALERFDTFGFGDRRESAVALMLAGAAPLVGMAIMDWDAGATLAVLLVNLLIGISDDLVRIAVAMRRSGTAFRERAEDEFVWPVAHALARGEKTVYAKFLPSAAQIESGSTQSPTWLAAGLAYLVGGFTAFMLTGPGSPLGSGEHLVLGTLPNLGLSLAFGLLHGLNRHPHWRQAGSVRLQTVATTAYFTAIIGGIVFFAIMTPSLAPAQAWGLVWMAGISTLGYGAWRLLALQRLHYTARWLKRSLRRMGVATPR